MRHATVVSIFPFPRIESLYQLANLSYITLQALRLA